MENLDEYSSYLYKKTGKKIHWYLGTCCLDYANGWCQENINSLKYSAEISECDVLVVGTKLTQSDIEIINEAVTGRNVDIVAFGNCAISGGPFEVGGQLSRLDEIDTRISLNIPGCPPTFSNFITNLNLALKVELQ